MRTVHQKCVWRALQRAWEPPPPPDKARARLVVLEMIGHPIGHVATADGAPSQAAVGAAAGAVAVGLQGASAADALASAAAAATTVHAMHGGSD